MNKKEAFIRFHIKTYGCQMNERDSEAAAAALIARGHQMTPDEGTADLLLFNTCSVRGQAERKALGKIGLMKKLKRDNPHLLIGVLGCMAQLRGNELLEEFAHVDFVLGTDQFRSLPAVVEEIAASHSRVVRVEQDESAANGIDGHLPSDGVSAQIAVMRGCDMGCAYCVVPEARGPSRSRAPGDVVEEARRLTAEGVKEIMLLGQNVSGYGLDRIRGNRGTSSPFASLLRELNALEGLARIRFTSPHPGYFNDDLVDAVTSLPKVCPSMHLPMQSGSDRILRLMRRPYTAEKYLSVIRSLKGKSPEMTFSTDIIVGFPTETAEDFTATRRVMDEVGFDNAYIFKYSPREKTPAAAMDDDVPTTVKEERNQLLLADLARRAEESNARLVGRTFEVLVEGASKRNATRLMGRTGTNKVVVFEPDNVVKPGDLVRLHIERCTSMTLFGKIIPQ